MCMYVFICMYIYIYIERERGRERERDIIKAKKGIHIQKYVLTCLSDKENGMNKTT